MHTELISDSRKTPGISIALCTLNGERFLREQLESFACQTRPPLELVVCDDCSEDRTLLILREFARAAAFPVRIHRNTKRLGSTANFDQAIRLCAGEYISLADQDDRWHSGKFARLAGVLDREAEVGAVFSDAGLMDADARPVRGSLWRNLRFGPKVQALFATDPGAVLLQRDVVSGHTMMFRRSLLARFPQIPTSWQHDGWLTWMSILWSQLRFLPEQLSEYRLHQAQAVGLGRQDRAARIRRIYGSERARYAHVAQQFADLLGYLEETSPTLAAEWREPLARKIAFLLARSNAPRSPMERMLFILKHTPSYFHLARGWRSMSRDCLLGPPGAR